MQTILKYIAPWLITSLSDEKIIIRYWGKHSVTIVKTELINIIKNGGDGELALDMLMVAKYLERIADHSVNIAEWVVYSVTGEYNE